MHIFMIANLPPYETGGAEVQARNLAESFIRQGHKVTVLGNRIPTTLLQVSESSEKINCIHIPTINLNKATRAISYSCSLAWLLYKNRRIIDALYSRFLREAVLIASLVKWIKLISAPLIACPACAGQHGDAYYLKRYPLSGLWVSVLNRNCNAFNIISPEIADELKQLGLDTNKFSYIPNGVTIRELPNHANPTPKKNFRRLIFVGRLAPQKGLKYLLSALSTLKSENYLFHLDIVGSGPDHQMLEELAKKQDVNDVISFHGNMGHEKVFEHLNDADIFVLPSISEGLSNALLEAMAAGLPCVVTRSGGSERLISSQTGRVADVADTNSLTSCLKEMLDLPLSQLTEMGNTARKNVQDNYSMPIIAQMNLDLFNSFHNKPEGL